MFGAYVGAAWSRPNLAKVSFRTSGAVKKIGLYYPLCIGLLPVLKAFLSSVCAFLQYQYVFLTLIVGLFTLFKGLVTFPGKLVIIFIGLLTLSASIYPLYKPNSNFF